MVSFLSWRAQKDCFATLQNLLRQTGVIPPFCCGSNPHVSGSNPGACNNLKKTTLSVVLFLSWRAQKDCFATLQNLLRQTGVIPPFCCGSNPHVSGSNPGACNNLKKTTLSVVLFLSWRAQKDSNPQPSDP